MLFLPSTTLQRHAHVYWRTLISLSEQHVCASQDLLIWDYFLPHSNSANRSAVPRMVQIVTMFPVHAHTTHKTGTYGGEQVSMEAERERRVESWRHGVDVCAFIGGWSPSPDPLASESVDKRYLLSSYDSHGRFPSHPPALLTPLGRKLLGLDAW